MKFNSSYWYKRATEMRSVANETKNLQSKQTMLGIAHDYDLLGCQFEYREKCALRDVIGTEVFVDSTKDPERSRAIGDVMERAAKRRLPEAGCKQHAGPLRSDLPRRSEAQGPSCKDSDEGRADSRRGPRSRSRFALASRLGWW